MFGVFRRFTATNPRFFADKGNCSYDLHLIQDLQGFAIGGVCDITFAVDAAKLNDANAKEITKDLTVSCFGYWILAGKIGDVPLLNVSVVR